METKTITLTAEEIDLLMEALDSHRYWQLSDPKYRRDGFILGRGSDDKETAQEIEASTVLEKRLEALKE